MERGKLGTLVDCLSETVDKLPERPEYSASKYTNRDAVNSAFGALFFQFPSLLRYMRELQEREKRDNVQSLFDVKGIPSDNHIRNIVDEIEPSAINPVFSVCPQSLRITIRPLRPDLVFSRLKAAKIRFYR